MGANQADFDIAIIGGGPAGMTAGMYAARGRAKTVLLEKSMKGGPYSVTDRIENFPGFPEGVNTEELMDKFRAQAERFGLEVREFTPVECLEADGPVKVVKLEDGTRIAAQALIVATGAQPAKLGVPGEKEFTGRGVSYCATCDGPLFKDKKVYVIGGGNAAIEEAVFLAKFASEVVVVHRRDELRADKILQERAFAEPKISFVWNSVLKEIRGDMLVKEIVLKDVVTGQESENAGDGVFIFVGTTPVTECLPPSIKKDDKGFIITGEDMQTSEAGIFAAGDCRSGALKQIVWAAAEGAKAAIQAERYVARLRKE